MAAKALCRGNPPVFTGGSCLRPVLGHDAEKVEKKPEIGVEAMISGSGSIGRDGLGKNSLGKP